MTLKQDALRRLYEKLIRQEPYAGGVCPAEHVLTAYESGTLGSPQDQLVAEHLSDCPACQAALEKLKDAGEWFDENESKILTGLAAKAGTVDVLPWARCPGVQLLYRHAHQQIPETGSGKVLLAEIDQHVWQCRQCASLVAGFRAAAAGQSLSIAELGARAAHAVQAKLANFLDAIASTVRASGGASSVRSAPGFRSDQVLVVCASVMDTQGNVAIDQQGQVCQCHFDVVQAEIANDGFLTLDLTATDAPHLWGANSGYEAAAWLVAGGVRLALAPTVIDERGRCTFTGVLPDAPAVESLPLSAVDLVVRPIAAGANGE